MIGIASESELIALAHALAGDTGGYSPAEREIVAVARLRPSSRLVATTKGLIGAGLDPLGDALLQLRSVNQRREVGAIYTPPELVNCMFAWVSSFAPPIRVVDPGCGSGRFILEAAAKFPNAHLVAIDNDPVATLLLRANSSVRRLGRRIQILCDDFRDLKLAPLNGPTLYVGNPPYVRHHDIEKNWKGWFARTAASFGIRASRLAGMHVHFFVKTRQLVREGDYGCYVTASEWLDVNYGSVVRKLLADGLGGTDIYLFSPEALPFSGTLTTAAVTCFRVGTKQSSSLAMHTVGKGAGGIAIASTRKVGWSKLSADSKWSQLTKAPRRQPAGLIEIGELFRVHRGQVTGNNGVWIAGSEAPSVPSRFLIATVTRAKELFDAGAALTNVGALKRVIDLPTNLERLDPDEMAMVERFLNWATKNDANSGFIAQHRRAWWSVGLREPAPILCTYMARRPPTFVRNLCEARNLNIAHGLYPRQSMSRNVLDSVAAYLRRENVSEGGRIYAGGLIKFEPREIERLCIPRPERLFEHQ